MLYPQSNRYRQCHDLSGFWDFCFDPEDQGLATDWPHGLKESRPIAVPASWNEQFADGRDYLGPSWYQVRFDLPWSWEKQRIFLRFGSVNYFAQAWLNGALLGEHEGGHLPFEFDITSAVQPENNLLIVRVEGLLALDRVPPEASTPFSEMRDLYPPTAFDFFPFCGIQRPVLLYTLPAEAITDLTVVTDLANQRGLVQVSVQVTSDLAQSAHVRLLLRGRDQERSLDIPLTDSSAHGVLEVYDVIAWSPAHPYLYDLTVELLQNDAVVDQYTLPVGVRTIEVKGAQLLLNGEPLYLTGFGRHEDFPVIGRGLVPAVIVKDYELMKWVGANSFRTSHYPYSEQMMDLADRLGFLVIDETPAVGLSFDTGQVERYLELCSRYTTELIARDKNHPSVIMWSLANEPHTVEQAAAKPFFQALYTQAKAQDTTRPVTMVGYVGKEEPAYSFCDVVCLNRYLGWYTEPGQLDLACAKLTEELDQLYELYQKPLLLSEFGADALAGAHALPPDMFSEEYQAEFLMRYIEVLRQKPYVIGEHVWNLCDFKTSQSIRRVNGLNLKGVFTRDRQPKLAAHRLREFWLHPTK